LIDIFTLIDTYNRRAHALIIYLLACSCPSISTTTMHRNLLAVEKIHDIQKYKKIRKKLSYRTKYTLPQS